MTEREKRREPRKGKNYITTAVKGMAQLKTDRLMEQHARDPKSTMEDVLNSLVKDTLGVEDLPLEDRFASLAMATYLVGILQGLAMVRESGLVSEDVMIKIVTGLSPDFGEVEELEDEPSRAPAILSRKEDKIFRDRPGEFSGEE
jgi:hypothetical protein